MSNGIKAMLVVVVIGVIGGGSALAYVLLDRVQGRSSYTEATAAEPAPPAPDYTPPASYVPQLPPPESLPVWVGEEGRFEDGYPRQSVQRTAVTAALHAQRFAALTTMFEELREAADADYRNEAQLRDAFRSFDTPDARVGTLIDAWVAASPESFAPHAARAVHLVELAMTIRGGAVAADTPRDRLVAAGRTAAGAVVSAQRAHALQPTCTALATIVAHPARMTHQRDVAEAMIARIAEAHPHSFYVHWARLVLAEPRWGGSPDAHRRFAEEAGRQATENPRLASLAHADDEVRCSHGSREERLAACHRLRGTATVPPLVALGGESNVLWGDERYDEAIPLIEQMKRYYPEAQVTKLMDAVLLDHRERYEEAAQVLLDLLRVDPMYEAAHRQVQRVTWGLNTRGWHAMEEGRYQDALRYHLTANLIDGRNEEHGDRRNMVTARVSRTNEEELQAGLAALEAAPNDFFAALWVDTLYFQRGRLADNVTMWTAFIERNPYNAEAYQERCGASQNRADCARACDLGLASACLGDDTPTVNLEAP